MNGRMSARLHRALQSGITDLEGLINPLLLPAPPPPNPGTEFTGNFAKINLIFFFF